MQGLTATIGELLIRLDEAMLLPLRDRSVRYLIRHGEVSGCVPATHQEIARYLGSSRARELAQLKRSGRIQTARGVVTLRRR